MRRAIQKLHTCRSGRIMARDQGVARCMEADFQSTACLPEKQGRLGMHTSSRRTLNEDSVTEPERKTKHIQRIWRRCQTWFRALREGCSGN